MQRKVIISNAYLHRLKLIGWAIAMLSADAAHAQTVLGHVSPQIVSKVQAKMTNAFLHGGIQEIVQDLKDCYGATSDERTVANENAVVTCLLYDYSAMLLNQGMVQAMVADGIPGAAAEPEPGSSLAYLTGQAFDARLGIYVPIPFGKDTHAFGPYFGDAPDKIASAVERSTSKSLTK